jgi:alkyl hydroperoxide reductase subunit D
MSLAQLKERLPAFAKDVRLNLSSLLQDDSLDQRQRLGLMLACALATRNPAVIAAAEAEAESALDSSALDAARTAAALMAMNNVYYRFTHLVSDAAYRTLPARLRMNAIANPGVSKVEFELWSLGVSAINGCGACIDAHERALREAGVSPITIQAAVRCAAVLQSVAIALEARMDG